MTKILVFDVDPSFRNGLQRALTSLGYEPIISNDGYNVLPLAEEHKPSLVILDFKLPEAAGFEILQRLRRTNTCANTPIIFASTTPKFEIEMTVLDAPSIGYIDKPLDAKQLKAAIEGLIGAPKAATKIAVPQQAQAAPPPMYIPPPGAPLGGPSSFTGEPDLDGSGGDVIDLD